jgi:Ferritin-like
MGVAIEEMTHLALASNLMAALGGRPHFGRPNFPVAPGYHPAGIVVRLAPFNMETLDHFIFLERPEGSEIQDSPAFASPLKYERIVPKRLVMPSSQDYATVGHLYRGIRDGFDYLAAAIGEKALFVCPASHQVGPAVASLPGLLVANSLASAHAAIDTIIDQGEGASEHRDDSHFSRFLAIKQEYAALLAANPAFSPAWPSAANPVMRKPTDATDRVYIDDPRAAALVDFANALYGQMLRFLVQAFGRAASYERDQALLIDGAIEMMRCMAPVADALARRPASPSRTKRGRDFRHAAQFGAGYRGAIGVAITWRARERACRRGGGGRLRSSRPRLPRTPPPRLWTPTDG